jgi:hypothetical protein
VRIGIKSERDAAAGAAFILIGVSFAVGAFSYSFGNAARPGPGYFPFGLGVLLAILGFRVFLSGLRFSRWKNSLGQAAEPVDRIDRWAVRPLFWVHIGLLVFGLLLPHLGMLICLPLLILIASKASENFNWREAALNAAVVTFISWLIFVKVLKLQIPIWPT